MRILRFHQFFFLIIFFSFYTAVARPAERNNSEHIPTEKIVEFTLLNLREDLNDIVTKNGHLEIQNSTLHKDINYLIRLLESLAVQKSQLSGQPLSFYFPKDQAHPDGLIDTQERKRRTEDLISHFEADVMKLREQVRILERKLEGRDFEAKRQTLLKTRESTRQSLSKMEKNIESWKKANEGPLKTIDGLIQEKSRLEQEIKAIEESPYRY